MKFNINSINPFHVTTLHEKAQIELDLAESLLFDAIAFQEYYQNSIEYNTKRIARLKEFLNSKDFKR